MTPQLLYVETYNGGSHARVLEILRECSRHSITAVTLPPEHWRWRSIAAHHDVATIVEQEQVDRPDAIVLSGPVNVPSLLQMLPASWGSVPVAVYFHESQWTYPTERHDTRPYVTGHLDALSVADRVWFNSEYHRDTFRNAALDHMSPRIRKLARHVLASRWGRTRIVYPPVRIDTSRFPAPVPRTIPRILWAARWVREKRPDRFVAAIERLNDAGIDFEVVILGAGAELHEHAAYRRIAGLVTVSGAIPARADYEAITASCDIVISTTDHEFFGVAILEAALSGVLPVLPRAHAYPETLPSAHFYPGGDLNALVRVAQAALRHSWGAHRPWISDARRFLPHRTVEAFDMACDELVDSVNSSNP